MTRFTKMNGAGNDFVLLDNRDGSLRLRPAEIARLCDRHRGIGADGLLLVEPASGAADFRMRYFNRDGGEAEMCGNGARCFARFARRLAGTPGDGPVAFETPAGVVRARLAGDLVELDMGVPRDLVTGRQLEVEGETLTVHSVNTGVPHAVLFVDNLDDAPVESRGRILRHHAAFAPKGTNVNFAVRTGLSALSIRTYERGVEAETLACGTGVVASALVLCAVHGAAPPVSVRVRGGDTLTVHFARTPSGFGSATLCGPADFVFEGEIAL